MTNFFNIADARGSQIVPVFSANGSLMLWASSALPTGMLTAYSLPKSILRPFSDHSLTIPPPGGIDPMSFPYEYYEQYIAALHKLFHDWAGQACISSFKNFKNMSETTKGVSADRIKNDPLFERTRENMAEFARAGKAAKLVRNIFREVMVNAKDAITHARLVKVFSRVVATDLVNGRGERVVSKGDLFQLQQFNFNVKAGMGDILFAKQSVNIDRTTGTAEVTIPAFVPKIMLQAPRGTTHFKLVLAAAAINFDTEVFDYASDATAELPWGQDATAPINLIATLPPGSMNPLLVVLCIEFYQKVNGRSYALKTGELNASTVIKVDKA